MVRLRDVVWLLGAVSMASGPAAAGYMFTTVDVSPFEVADMFGINNRGQVAGSLLERGATGPGRGFITTRDGFVPLQVPGAELTTGRSLNDSGQAVGTWWAPGNPHAFVYDGRSYTTLMPPGAVDSWGLDISNSGRVVGNQVNGQSFLGFTYERGNFTPLSVPGATFTEVFGANNRGDVIGWYGTPANILKWFVYRNGSFETIEPPPGGPLQQFELNDINNAGEMTGWIAPDGTINAVHGFVMRDGSLELFDFPGADRTLPWGINDRGQVSGMYFVFDEQDNNVVRFGGFIATPIPEPAAILMLGPALLVLGAVRWSERSEALRNARSRGA
jgi:uncharacterized membrane protein